MAFGFRPGFGGFGGFRPGFGAYRPGFGFRSGYGYGGFFPGLVFGSLLGSAVASPYYHQPYRTYPYSPYY